MEHLPNRDELATIAQAVSQAVIRHASLCEQNPANGAEIVPALIELQRSLRAYALAVTEISGWADPIRGYALEDDDIPEEVETTTKEMASGSKAKPWYQESDVMVFDHYFLKIHNPKVFLSYATDRLGSRPSSLDEAAEALCRLDGWQPSSYPGGVRVDQRHIDTCFS